MFSSSVAVPVLDFVLPAPRRHQATGPCERAGHGRLGQQVLGLDVDDYKTVVGNQEEAAMCVPAFRLLAVIDLGPLIGSAMASRSAGEHAAWWRPSTRAHGD